MDRGEIGGATLTRQAQLKNEFPIIPILELLKKYSPPLEGGDKGERKFFKHPHPDPLPSRERDLFSPLSLSFMNNSG